MDGCWFPRPKGGGWGQGQLSDYRTGWGVCFCKEWEMQGAFSMLTLLLPSSNSLDWSPALSPTHSFPHLGQC